MRKLLLACAIVFASSFQVAYSAVETQIEVGVLANGAKFIGDKTGGAYVVITDEGTGKVLAEGVTKGSTGDTQRIMQGEGGRYGDISSSGDAVFRTHIPLDAPVKVTIKATGPLGYPDASSSAAKSVWLIPGQTLEKDNRVLIELAGYIIQPTSVAIDSEGKGIVNVDLQMLCGCPITPGGTWDAERIHKTATLVNKAGKTNRSVPLVHTGTGTIYKATFDQSFASPHSVRIELSALDHDNTASLDIPVK